MASRRPAADLAIVRQPTLETVAALAGVSRATVSRVINDASRVSPQVRTAVEEAIERIGYVPNRAARSLVTRKTDSIAVVVREPVEFGVADPYLSSIVVAASQSLAGTGVQLAVMMAANDEDHAKLAGYVRGGHVDGVILVSVHDDDPLPRQLIRARVPVVIGGRPASPLDGVSYVDVDNVAGRRWPRPSARRGSHAAGDDRRAAGHHVGDRPARRLPRGTARPSPAAAGRRVRRVHAGVRGAGRDRAASPGARPRRHLRRQRPHGDRCAARDQGCGPRRSDDVAVIGFDDIEISQHTEPPLTTIHQDIAVQAG
jgi:hypothetical protein